MEGSILQLAATLHVHSTQLCLFYNVWFSLDGFINTQNYRVWNSENLRSHDFIRKKLAFDSYLTGENNTPRFLLRFNNSCHLS